MQFGCQPSGLPACLPPAASGMEIHVIQLLLLLLQLGKEMYVGMPLPPLSRVFVSGNGNEKRPRELSLNTITK